MDQKWFRYWVLAGLFILLIFLIISIVILFHIPVSRPSTEQYVNITVDRQILCIRYCYDMCRCTPVTAPSLWKDCYDRCVFG